MFTDSINSRVVLPAVFMLALQTQLSHTRFVDLVPVIPFNFTHKAHSLFPTALDTVYKYVTSDFAFALGWSLMKFG